MASISRMAGTPWHVEYGKSSNEKDSTNCVYNRGYCACIASCYYHKTCIGKLSCDEFDQNTSPGNKSINYKTKTSTLHKVATKTNAPTKLTPQQQAKPVKKELIVEINDEVTLYCYNDNKVMPPIKVTEKTNISYGRKLKEAFNCKGLRYSIEYIKKHT